MPFDPLFNPPAEAYALNVGDICEAEESFSSFLNDGGLEHYISGCDSLYAFLSLYELSDNYQADNYLAIDEARLRLIVSSVR